MIPPSLPAILLPTIPRPGQLTGAAMRPSFSLQPSQPSVVERERRLLPERWSAGLGMSTLVDVMIPFKAIISRTISALHRLGGICFHAAAEMCAAPGNAGEREKSNSNGKFDHVKRSDVMRACEQKFFAFGPNFVGRLMGTGIPQAFSEAS